MKLLGPVLAVVGVILLIVAGVQHLVGFVGVTHAAIYLGILGLVALVPGVWLSLRRSS